jgi:ssDNA-binding Zn-finger/Zn-ribbon topoisomerase 1
VPDAPPPDTFTPICPICAEEMEKIYGRNGRHVFGCNTCHTDVLVPTEAWEKARQLRRQLANQAPLKR